MSPLCFSQLMMKLEEEEASPLPLYRSLLQVMQSLFSHGHKCLGCALCSNMLFDWLCQSLSLQSPQIVLRTLHPNQYLWQAPPLWWPLLQMREMRYLWTRKKKSKHLTRISFENIFCLCLYIVCFVNVCWNLNLFSWFQYLKNGYFVGGWSWFIVK